MISITTSSNSYPKDFYKLYHYKPVYSNFKKSTESILKSYVALKKRRALRSPLTIGSKFADY